MGAEETKEAFITLMESNLAHGQGLLDSRLDTFDY